MAYGIVLKEKECTHGLDRHDVIELFDKLHSTEVYPIELEARDHECCAMGFITPEVAEIFYYDYETSGLRDFIANILDDIINESDDCTYEFKGVEIWLG